MAEGNGKKGLLLCVCLGTCPSFQQMDIFEVVNTLREAGDVTWAAIHPQLCAADGDAFLADLLKGLNDLDLLVVGGCAPLMQQKMFRDALQTAGFSPDKHVAVDVRNMTTQQAVEALRRALAQPAAAQPAQE